MFLLHITVHSAFSLELFHAAEAFYAILTTCKLLLQSLDTAQYRCNAVFMTFDQPEHFWPYETNLTFSVVSCV